MPADLVEHLRLPVVAAPMFLVSGPDLVIAACRSRIVGSFPTPNCRTIDALDSWMGTIDDAVGSGDTPWAVNLVTHRTNTRLAEDLRLIAQYRPGIVITALGSPAPVVEVVKNYGGIVIADVVNPTLARKAVATGVDGLACVSSGAGGHTGHLSPFAFISAVRDFFDGIITVGGAITDGAGVAGAITAGADLVYMGTRFLASTESMATDAYKQMIVDHGLEDILVSDAITGTDASWLRPSLIANGYDPDTMAFDGDRRSYDSAGDQPARWKDVWAAGQGLATIRSVDPVAKIVDRLEDEYIRAANRFTGLVTHTHRLAGQSL
ncbi:nitronate monooxygenase [Gordonia sp. ABSL11-1]|uniref:NAD(P)H-dependent flavin oxidoreductase n=1 Tax=Gordonia sp. ABSL11-1 TaxID=3053924 RepID=UPI0025745C79|nr:nitronate monooxygenase [Gordonia sp. ABSL11-1]MDL9948129.1 nitronate monooxygenase [Gordonia sp. ABSL11-1]